ncbi:hypothetical protein DFJ74DRAFT_677956 [Hyaloraphidium curvatum]|nr:hypothetical protein DFJ74DRAFT_677956 [Hyaloraphidium curvatum]
MDPPPGSDTPPAPLQLTRAETLAVFPGGPPATERVGDSKQSKSSADPAADALLEPRDLLAGLAPWPALQRLARLGLALNPYARYTGQRMLVQSIYWAPIVAARGFSTRKPAACSASASTGNAAQCLPTVRRTLRCTLPIRRRNLALPSPRCLRRANGAGGPLGRVSSGGRHQRRWSRVHRALAARVGASLGIYSRQRPSFHCRCQCWRAQPRARARRCQGPHAAADWAESTGTDQAIASGASGHACSLLATRFRVADGDVLGV